MFSTVASRSSTSYVKPEIQLSIARSRSDLEESFRLVHQSYVRAGLDLENDTKMRLIRHHLLPSTEVLMAKDNGSIVSTVTLIGDSEHGLPAESMYRQEIQEMRRHGLRIAEIGCLADHRKSPARFFQMLQSLAPLIAQAATSRGYNAVLAATHPRHARFYTRRLGFETFGEIRECPYAHGNPAIAMLLDFEAKRGSELHSYLFGQEFSANELAPFAWDDATKSHFESILKQIEAAESTQTSTPPITPLFNVTTGSLPTAPSI